MFRFLPAIADTLVAWWASAPGARAVSLPIAQMMFVSRLQGWRDQRGWRAYRL